MAARIEFLNNIVLNNIKKNVVVKKCIKPINYELRLAKSCHKCKFSKFSKFIKKEIDEMQLYPAPDPYIVY